uniref:Gamma-secretase subunit APH-1 n=1 Tax=Zosterops lateralis melanops TaxID=1220523 RepID=A0A8D2PYY3_ZOSLA
AAYVSGLSFGIISGLFSITNTLADSAGPGTVGIHGDSPYYFITSAFLTMALVLLHTFWGIIFFDACERRRAWGLGLVVGSHLLTSGLTFLNPWYEATLGPIFILTLCTGLWAFCTAGGSFHNVLKCLSCTPGIIFYFLLLRIKPFYKIMRHCGCWGEGEGRGGFLLPLCSAPALGGTWGGSCFLGNDEIQP